MLYVPSEEPVLPLEQQSSSETASNQDLQFPGYGRSAAGQTTGSIQTFVWRPALKAAMILAVPAAILSSGLSSIGLLCMAAAAAWAVNLYSKQSRTRWLTMGTGARIGLLTSILACWLTLGLDGMALWVKRFLLHQGAQIDSGFTTMVTTSFSENQQKVAQMGMSSPQYTQWMDTVRGWMLSADGRAASALFDLVLMAVFLVLFGTVGGAVGARFLKPAHRPSA